GHSWPPGEIRILPRRVVDILEPQAIINPVMRPTGQLGLDDCGMILDGPRIPWPPAIIGGLPFRRRYSRVSRRQRALRGAGIEAGRDVSLIVGASVALWAPRIPGTGGGRLCDRCSAWLHRSGIARRCTHIDDKADVSRMLSARAVVRVPGISGVHPGWPGGCYPIRV
ncbi:MAG: hypothetical protein V3R73_00985, partial [Sphingomonadales bacterium]